MVDVGIRGTHLLKSVVPEHIFSLFREKEIDTREINFVDFIISPLLCAGSEFGLSSSPLVIEHF